MAAGTDLRVVMDPPRTEPGPLCARTLSVGSLFVAIGGVVASLLAAGSLPNSLRIRWHVGANEHWGPAVVPTDLAMAFVPTILVIGYVESRVLGRFVEDRHRWAYEFAVLASLAGFASLQLLLIGLNLVIR